LLRAGIYPAPVLRTLEAPVIALTADANAAIDAKVAERRDPTPSFRSGLVTAGHERKHAEVAGVPFGDAHLQQTAAQSKTIGSEVTR